MSFSLSEALQSAVEHLHSEFAKLQVGRAQPSLIEKVNVMAYGSQMPLAQMANISCPDASTLRVEPWDQSQLAEIEKAIVNANLGLNPKNTGDNLIITVPALTEDRRREIAKTTRQLAEEAKISVRHARHEELQVIKQQKESKDISEDEAKDRETQALEQKSQWWNNFKASS